MHWLMLAPLIALPAAPASLETKRFMVTGFDRIRIEGPFEVEIVPGSPSAAASGDAAALARVSARVEGTTLVINGGAIGWQSRAPAPAPTPAKVAISIPALRSLTVRGGATVKVAAMRGQRVDLVLDDASAIVGDVRAEDLAVTLNGGGTLILAGVTARTRIRSSGSGAIAAERLVAGEAMLATDSSGDITIGVRFTASVSTKGTGGVVVLGNPLCRVTGSAPVRCGAR